jgi:glycerol-3-phosphate cytidylyltransferase
MINEPIYNIGVIAGNFDVLHPGYLKMFQEIEKKCERLFILLQEDPTIERPEKKKPILSVDERREMLKQFTWYHTILTYNTESELLFLLKSINPDVRFLGDDYIGKTYTGFELNTPVIYLDRSHGWSTTKFKQAIADSL